MDHPITQFRDIHKGERCFIIGNGPSLARTPLNLIKGEYSIGVNRIGMRFAHTDWRPSHFMCITNWVGKEAYRADVNHTIDLGIPCFIGERIRYAITRKDKNIIWIKHLIPHLDESFNPNNLDPEWWLRDISDGTLSFFSNSSFAVTRLAAYMGFNPLYMVGFDLDWKYRDNKTGLDPNHFDPAYEDETYQKPAGCWDRFNPLAIIAHELIRDCAEKIGVKVYNATLGGNLEAYPRVNFLRVALKARKRRIKPRKSSVEELFNKYDGERIFIVGSGKSLTVDQLDIIKGEYSFGINRIGRIYSETDWRPSFYMAAPPEYLKYKYFRDDMIKTIQLGIPSFLCVRLRSHIENDIEYGFGDIYENVHYISCKTETRGEELEWWATDYAHGGKVKRYSSSAFRASMISIKMGFSEIVLIGCDVNYKDQEIGKPDPNHFADDYAPFLGDSQTGVGALNKSIIEQYEVLREQAQAAGVTIVNATEGGLLEVFPRASLKEIVQRRSK